MNFAEFCAALGCPLRNNRWSWCAVAPDGERIVFTLWQDHFKGREYPISYHDERVALAERPGYVELLAALDGAKDDTELLGVLCIAKDPKADPRVRKDFDARTLLKLRIETRADGSRWAVVIGRVAADECRAAR